jgi:hypothetical protein
MYKLIDKYLLNYKIKFYKIVKKVNSRKTMIAPKKKLLSIQSN